MAALLKALGKLMLELDAMIFIEVARNSARFRA
jgi:hypothetical protein